MKSIPVAVVWVAVLCGYLPYQMGFAFFNPLLVLSYAYLGLLVGATLLGEEPTWKHAWQAMAIVVGTLCVALAMVNLWVWTQEIVLPEWGILLTALAIAVSSVLMMKGLAAWLLRRGWAGEQVKFRLRMVFAVLALAVYCNRYLPYEWKVWIAEHTTDEDLIRFGMGSSALFVGIWRLTR